MAVTAARLGKKITLDWTHLGSGAASSLSSAGSASGNSVTERDVAWKKLSARFEKGEVGFFDCPLVEREDLHHLNATKTLVKELTTRTKFTDVLYLGIGGSSLGPATLIRALEDKVDPGAPKIHFLDSPDPLVWRSTIAKISPASTLVVAVTKSGTTFETVVQFLNALDWLGRERWKSHVILVTDPEKGDLRRLAHAEKLNVLSIAQSIGGRFSVFTPVGTLPLLLSGLNADHFLTGAREVREALIKTPIEKNPLFRIAEQFIDFYPEKKIHVFMPYSNRLQSVGTWFVQLWGESLGKDLKGFTPVAAVGPTDQHSILQLLRDGPNDKVTCFLTVDKMHGDTPSSNPTSNPHAPKLSWKETFPAFQQVEGISFENLLNIEYQATARVLTNRERPHFTLRLDDLSENSIGSLLFSLCTLTAVTGTLWNVDPFDQPGVEEAKVYIREMLQNAKTEAQSQQDTEAVHRLRLGRQD